MSLTADDLAVIQSMIATGQGVGEGFPQPIVAGQQLLIPGIQSPNFSLAGQTGWQILKTGLATFFNVVLSGGTLTGPDYIINPSGAFFYNGAPANGNLIVSIAPASGVDGFGNAYPQGINVTTGTIAGAAISGSTFSGTDFLINSAGAFFYNGTPALGNLILALAEAAGNDAFANPFPQGLLSQQLTLPNQGAAPPAFAGASVLYSSTAGRPRYLSSAGADAVLERSTVNVSQFSTGNVIVPAVISGPLNYLGGEAAQSSEYEIEVLGTGTTGAAANTFTFSLFMDAANFAGSFVVGAAAFPVGTVFFYRVRFLVSVTATGAAGTAAVTSSGMFGRGNGANTALPSVSVVAGNSVAAAGWDTTANHTFQLYGNWGGASAGQALTTYRTKVRRSM